MPFASASKSRDCVTTEINTGARASSRKHVLDRKFQQTLKSTMFRIAAKRCFLHDTHGLIYITGKATTVLSFNRKLSVKGSSSFLRGEEINFIVFENYNYQSVRHYVMWKAVNLKKRNRATQSHLNAISSGKRRSIPYASERVLCETFSSKGICTFSLICCLVDKYWKHLKPV